MLLIMTDYVFDVDVTRNVKNLQNYKLLTNEGKMER